MTLRNLCFKSPKLWLVDITLTQFGRISLDLTLDWRPDYSWRLDLDLSGFIWDLTWFNTWHEPCFNKTRDLTFTRFSWLEIWVGTRFDQIWLCVHVSNDLRIDLNFSQVIGALRLTSARLRTWLKPLLIDLSLKTWDKLGQYLKFDLDVLVDYNLTWTWCGSRLDLLFSKLQDVYIPDL